MSNEINTIGVIGAGSWGTALAATTARAGRKVILWARDAVLADAINQSGENAKYLAGVKLPGNVTATHERSALGNCDAVLVVTPAQAQAEIMAQMSPHLRPGIPALLCSKGIEQKTGRFMSDVLAETAPALVPYVLSGPSFAADVVRGLPTAVTLAGPDVKSAARVGNAIGYKAFRIYASDDVIGAEVGGAVKNVLAIACGISDGKQLGASCRAALITRAFAELARFGRALGAKSETLSGLSGFGDLILTASSMQSRNYSLGFELGAGKSLKDILAARNSVCEGVHTASIVAKIAARKGIDMPICSAVRAVVEGSSDPDSEIARLLARPMRAEHDQEEV